MRYDWERVKEIFEVDGALRDIYVLDTTVDDWQKVLDALRSQGYPLSIAYGESGREVSQDVRTIFTTRSLEEWWPTLSVMVSGVTIHCHFFIEEEIEFDIDPREIVSAEQFDAILQFMRVISHAIGKEAILTMENCQEWVFVRVSGDSEQII